VLNRREKLERLVFLRPEAQEIGPKPTGCEGAEVEVAIPANGAHPGAGRGGPVPADEAAVRDGPAFTLESYLEGAVSYRHGYEELSAER
jgi:hypothetical protein